MVAIFQGSNKKDICLEWRDLVECYTDLVIDSYSINANMYIGDI